jgi:hypothetical protein
MLIAWGIVAVSKAAHKSAFPWDDLLVQITGAFVGAAFAFGFALWLARRDRRSDRTAVMILEYSSREMLQSRFVTTNIAYQIEAGSLTLREVALTSVQDCPVGFEGNVIDGLTEHQHMSHLIGWLRRLAVHMSNHWVDRKVMAATLGGSLQWTLPFFLQLAEEAERIVSDYPSVKPIELRASWVFAIRSVDRQIREARPHRRVPGGR